MDQWADTRRFLSHEASAEPGKYRTERAPYQRGIMQACSDPNVEQVICMTASQIGKTEVELNVVGYYIDQDPSPILVVLPSVDPDAKAWSQDRLAPMLRDTPVLSGKVRDARARDSGNTILHKQYPGGHVTLVGANSPAGLAARPIRILLCDEVDKFPPSAGAEGDPISLAVRRTATFWNRKIILVSTPTVKDFSRIEAAWKESDQRRYWVPCPHCGHRQLLRWANIKWPKGKPEDARLACEGCGVLIEEGEKHQMLSGGEWLADNPGSRIAGFHINALYSPWARWGDLAREWINAQGNTERLKVFINTVLGEVFEEQGEQVPVTELEKRREPYEGVPATVGILTAGVDVQGDRLEVSVYGWGAGEECWLVAHERLYGDPDQEEVWGELDKLLLETFPHATGRGMRIRSCGVDTGAFTNTVYKFVRPRQKRGVYAIKGASGGVRTFLTRAKNPAAGVRLITVSVDMAKDVLFKRLLYNEAGKAGFIHFPLSKQDSADEEFLLQFGAEKASTKWKKGVYTRIYTKIRDRNEAIDMWVYAYAALYALGRRVTDQLGKWAERMAPTPEKPPEEPENPMKPEPPVVKAMKKAARKVSGRGFVHRW